MPDSPTTTANDKPAAGDAAPHARVARPRRRFRQFGLRTLLVLMALCAAAFAWYSNQIGPYKRQALAIEKLEARGVLIKFVVHEPSWFQRLATEVRVGHVAGVWFLQDRNGNSLQLTDQDYGYLDDLIDVDYLLLRGITTPTKRQLSHVWKLRSLRMLELQNADITDELLVGIANLQALAYLSLADTQITDAGLRELGQLPRLTALDLRDTEITGSGLTALRSASELRFLDLSRTQIEDTALAPLRELTKLQELRVPQTQITDRALAHFDELKHLVELDLSATLVEGPGLAHLKHAVGLSVLDLSFTPFEGASLEHIAQSELLGKLELVQTHVRDEDLIHLSGMKSLELLDLSATNVEGKGLSHLSGLPKLVSLRLDGAPLEDSQLIAIKQMPQLNYLYLNQTGFGDIGAKRLVETCPAIEELELNGTHVTAVGIRTACSLRNLTNLTLMDVQVTAAEVIELERSLGWSIRPRDPDEDFKLRRLQRLSP
jgi:Leucine-rich repeat (LRR) protein